MQGTLGIALLQCVGVPPPEGSVYLCGCRKLRATRTWRRIPLCARQPRGSEWCGRLGVDAGGGGGAHKGRIHPHSRHQAHCALSVPGGGSERRAAVPRCGCVLTGHALGRKGRSEGASERGGRGWGWAGREGRGWAGQPGVHVSWRSPAVGKQGVSSQLKGKGARGARARAQQARVIVVAGAQAHEFETNQSGQRGRMAKMP